MRQKNQNPVIIVQARMQSTRLPKKVLMRVLDTPLLNFLIERLRRVRNAKNMLVATTKETDDEAIVQFCDKSGVQCYRGDENDVLDRYLQAAKAVDADPIIRITADCPLIDPEVVEQVIQVYLNHEFDYVSNTLIRTYPRGMDTEVFSRKSLEVSAFHAKEQSEKEHVTLYLYRHPERFKLENVACQKNLSKYRLTVDTKEDFKLIKSVIEGLYPKKPQLTLEDIIRFLDNHPELIQINRHIVQKQIEK